VRLLRCYIAEGLTWPVYASHGMCFPVLAWVIQVKQGVCLGSSAVLADNGCGESNDMTFFRPGHIIDYMI
jgi:hypothetical protein